MELKRRRLRDCYRPGPRRAIKFPRSGRTERSGGLERRGGLARCRSGRKTMTDALQGKTCTPCRGGVEPLTRQRRRTVPGADARVAPGQRGPPDRTALPLRRFPRRAVLRGRRRRARRGRRPPSRHPFRLGLRDDFPADQEDQGIARERLHSSRENRPPFGRKRRRLIVARDAAPKCKKPRRQGRGFLHER